jgi:hypothetical protein
VDWDALTAAGAFVVGAALGTLATIRVAKVIGAYLAALRDDPPDPEPPRE